MFSTIFCIILGFFIGVISTIAMATIICLIIYKIEKE